MLFDQAVTITVRLAGVTTARLLVLATPVAWWLSHKRSLFKDVVALGPDSPLMACCAPRAPS